jgi:hypothetical protein
MGKNMNFCKCGCGQITKNTFIRFHHLSKIHRNMIGKKMPEDVRQKLSQTKKGVSTISLDGRKRISEKAKLRWQNSEYKKYMSNIFKGKIGNKNPFYGKHHTEESKIKIVANRRYYYGEQHHWFKPNRKRQYSIQWTNTLKKAIRERDNYKCQICGIPQEEYMRNLDVHHIDGNKYNCNPNNLISLCAICHTRLEHKKSVSPIKTAETAGNPERAIRNEASQEERSETIMVASLENDDGIVRSCKELQKNDCYGQNATS